MRPGILSEVFMPWSLRKRRTSVIISCSWPTRFSAFLSMWAAFATGHSATTNDSPPVNVVHICSVINGITGCIKRKSWSRTWPKTRLLASALPDANASFESSRYQSQRSSHAKWYINSQARANSYFSSSSVVSFTVSDRRLRIHLSMALSESSAGKSPVTVAPFIIAKRVAFQSLVAKLRDPPIQSSASAWSVPGLAPRAKVKRNASAPYLSINSMGSTTFPRLFDIFLPNWSRTKPCNMIVLNGATPSIAKVDIIIMRTTQKNKMS